jgi:hypothetical protein
MQEQVENFMNIQELKALPESVEFIRNLIINLIKAKKTELMHKAKIMES